jgi:ArsR family transcriptional regulator, arsenate/arsenite/antimonite-responsive transcriptional repressor
MTGAKLRTNPRNIIPLIEADTCCVAPVRVDTAELAPHVKTLSALADPTRLGIVTMLARSDEPVCVCEIVDGFELGQPTISHHLRILREAGIVDCEKRGLWVYYWLQPGALKETVDYVRGFASR